MTAGVRLVDAKVAFAEQLSSMMEDEGLFDGRFEADELREMVRLCTEDAFVPCWEEFMEWVVHGNPRRAETMATLRSSIRGIGLRRRAW